MLLSLFGVTLLFCVFERCSGSLMCGTMWSCYFGVGVSRFPPCSPSWFDWCIDCFGSLVEIFVEPVVSGYRLVGCWYLL